MKTIKKIVFTGGPCGGKTTFASRAQEVFAEHGYRVIVDNESATDLISGGISPATIGMYEFQKYCIGLQLKKEELCLAAAEEIEGDKVIVFIDRGIMDDKGFVTDEEFERLMKDFNLTEQSILDRYDMVLHLVSAANGAEEAYSFASNAARYETAEQARKVDIRTLECWKNHPNRVAIGNETDFERKLVRAMGAVFDYLGDGKPVEVFKKYLIDVDENVINQVKKEGNSNFTHILQHYLVSNQASQERRIRKREKDGNSIYYYSEANTLSTNSRIKKDRILSERQYREYMAEANKDLKPIDKDRFAFIHDGYYYKLDIYDFDKTKGLLSVQVPGDDENIKLPEYVHVLKDVSNIKDYKNYYLAKSQKF